MPLPRDPLLAQQWHLSNRTLGLFDLNVLGVWNPAEGLAYTGAGTRTVVIDDGFDYNHQDFDNYDQRLDYDFELNTRNPFGTAEDAHGTAVAGIIGAAADGTGAVGVAFGTSLIGYRTAGLISDDWLQDIRDAIASAATDAGADVANISQGIANDSFSTFGAGYAAVRFDEIEASIATAVNDGRDGLGMTIIKSAGNSREDNYDVNADDWTNDTRQVVVAAVDQNGFVSSYSSYGAAVLIAGFGTPDDVLTTDRTGAAGYTADDFTTFNGTSAAAPTVAGVVSLMYEANAGLGWRDVQSILAVSARHVGSEVGAASAAFERNAWGFNGAGTWNGGGQHFSNDYGYGLVDALAAVRLAETWLLTGTAAATSANQVSNTMDILNVATAIPDGNATGLSFTGNAAFDDVVERVTVQMSFSATYTGDMEVYLTSPSGTVSRLIADTGNDTVFNGVWTFESQAFRGERAAGQWTVRVVDAGAGDVLNVSDIVIRTFGASTTDDRYIFTNEFSDYAGISGHETAINDTNSGIDTVNAAAVTSASIIRLDGLAGVIDGIGVTFANIEHAIGGDFGDQIFGNGVSNKLHGMRGADTLTGGGGDDFLYGGTNNDVLNGGTGADVLVGGLGNDIFVIDAGDVITEDVGAGTDTVRSSVSFALGANLEHLILSGSKAINGFGNDLANRIIGNAANNVLNGGTGADTLIGGLGDDTYVTDGGDAIIEGVGEGTDLVRSSVSLALGANFENLVLTGSATINGIGNDLANRIIGNAANNVLNGGTGADTLIGGLGDDTYVTDGGDAIAEGVGGGTDTVRSSVNFALGANLDNLILTGSGAINGLGNSLANRIIGNDGNNALNGGTGADMLTGLGGADAFIFNTALGAGNVDRITDFNVVDDTIRLDDLIFTGLASGLLTVGAFEANTTGQASDALDRIIYETGTGNLFFDADGFGAGMRVQFAALNPGLALTHADFLVF